MAGTVTGDATRPRLALLGDIHGNLPALDAVLAAVRRAGITRGALTGDLVARGGEPEECVARLSALGWPCAKGNTDQAAERRVVPPFSEGGPTRRAS